MIFPSVVMNLVFAVAAGSGETGQMPSSSGPVKPLATSEKA